MKNIIDYTSTRDRISGSRTMSRPPLSPPSPSNGTTGLASCLFTSHALPFHECIRTWWCFDSSLDWTMVKIIEKAAIFAHGWLHPKYNADERLATDLVCKEGQRLLGGRDTVIKITARVCALGIRGLQVADVKYRRLEVALQYIHIAYEEKAQGRRARGKTDMKRSVPMQGTVLRNLNLTCNIFHYFSQHKHARVPLKRRISARRAISSESMRRWCSTSELLSNICIVSFASWWYRVQRAMIYICKFNMSAITRDGRRSYTPQREIEREEYTYTFTYTYTQYIYMNIYPIHPYLCIYE